MIWFALVVVVILFIWEACLIIPDKLPFLRKRKK